MKNRFVMVAVIMTALTVWSCGGGPSAPTPVPTPTPTPTPTPVPTPTPTGFSFITLGQDAMGIPSSALPVWGLRGLNTALGVKQMVFGDQSAQNNPGLHGIYRVAGPVSLYVAPDFEPKLGDFSVIAKEWEKLTGFALTQAKGSSPFSIGYGDLTPNQAALVYRQCNADRTVIIGAQIVVRQGAGSRFTILHELGHVFGLEHWVGFGLMGNDAYGMIEPQFSLAELDNASMMLRVPLGVFPPTDGGIASRTTSLSAEGVTETIACRLVR